MTSGFQISNFKSPPPPPAAIKLAVLQRTWHMASKGSASRARRELIQRASSLAATPHNQAEIIDSLIRRCGPLIREHGFAGLVAVLSDKG